MSVLEIINQNNPKIRQKSEEVKGINEEIKQIIQDLKDTLASTEGVGIAAPQVGILKRIIYVHFEEKEYVLLNPTIVMQEGKIEDYEGCLSVGEEGYAFLYGKVERAFLIEVEALNEKGENIKLVADGMLARIFQHEIDHLEGILYTDKKIGDVKKFKTIEERNDWKETRKKHKKKVLLGMSGGVDSSVSAVVLKEMGYDVIGATMKLWECKENPEIEGACCSFSATYDAKRVCDQLEIPHYTLNCEKEFQTHVIDDFISCYEHCKTPNPCIECNKYLKFGTFYQKALELGCDYVATGHYAKIEYSEEYKQYVMKKSEADKKDQTYFLYSIQKEILPNILYPLESFKEKENIRKIAQLHDLKVAHKKDSQEVCFIPDNDYVNFLQKNKKQERKIGNIILQDGTILGKHKGLIHYTIGQRKGLGVSYKKPLYVIALSKEKEEVIVGEEKDLYQQELKAKDCNFLIDIDFNKPMAITAKVRYRAKEAKAVLTMENGIAKVVFEEPQRAITAGQSVVFYIGDVVVGGGKII